MRVDIAMQELDRILDRYDVRKAIQVYVLQHGGQRGRLARPGNPGYEHKPARRHGDLLGNRRKIELADRARLKRDYAKGISDRSPLLVCVDAKATHSGNTERVIRFLEFRELLHVASGHRLLGDVPNILEPDGRELHRDEIAVDAQCWRPTDLYVKIGRAALHHLVQNRLVVER